MFAIAMAGYRPWDSQFFGVAKVRLGEQGMLDVIRRKEHRVVANGNKKIQVCDKKNTLLRSEHPDREA